MKIPAAAFALFLLSACAPAVPKAENVATNAMTDDEVTEVQDESVVATDASDSVADNVAVDRE